MAQSSLTRLYLTIFGLNSVVYQSLVVMPDFVHMCYEPGMYGTVIVSKESLVTGKLP